MTKRTGASNEYLRSLIVQMRKAAKANDAKIWEDVAEALAKPRRQKVEVNLIDIERHAGDSEVVVPGIVLAKGDLTKAMTVAAWRFTSAARGKIKRSGGDALTIAELLEKNPKGEKVKIMV